MKYLSCLFILCGASVGWAKVQVVASQRKPAQDEPLARLANSTFTNFLGCGRTPRSPETESGLYQCVAQFFAKSVGPTRIRNYTQAVEMPSEYSTLFKCEPEYAKMVMAYEDKDYDFFYCFESNLYEPKRTGVVIFKLERGMPKILRLKI